MPYQGEDPTGRFIVEVIADNSGQWCGNGIRFATHDDAAAYAKGLAWRWTLVREWRVRELEEGA
jgi:hypothetical protein